MLVHKANYDANVLLFDLDAVLQERMDAMGETLRHGAKGKRR